VKGHADLIAMEGGKDWVNLQTRELEKVRPDLNKRLELKESHSLLSIARYGRREKRVWFCVRMKLMRSS
jgi:hypothetical protein